VFKVVNLIVLALREHGKEEKKREGNMLEMETPNIGV
jgi:hypothetical protein